MGKVCNHVIHTYTYPVTTEAALLGLSSDVFCDFVLFFYFWVFPGFLFNIPHSASEANAWPAVSLHFITPVQTDLSRVI